jgi:hypothetical protein
MGEYLRDKSYTGGAMKILMRTMNTDKWALVESAGYKAETELQRLLAESPSLISLSDILGEASPLVAAVREVGLPGSGSTDILAFNPQGQIVVVECKLAANAEIKRKVIAQVLEYGAFLWEMSYETLNQLIVNRVNMNLADLVSEAVGDPDWDEEEFRKGIEENLARGAFILVIAVDEMNDELSRTIRFLNNCGSPGFVFTALEMRRFQNETAEILVPHLFSGVQSGGKKLVGEKTKQWTMERFFETVELTLDQDVINITRDIYVWSTNNADKVFWGMGKSTGSFTFHYHLDGKTVSVFTIYSTGQMMVNYGYLSTILDQAAIMTFHQALTAIPPFKHLPADFKKFPMVKIEDVFIAQPEYVSRFKNAVEDLGRTIKNAQEKTFSESIKTLTN